MVAIYGKWLPNQIINCLIGNHVIPARHRLVNEGVYSLQQSLQLGPQAAALDYVFSQLLLSPVIKVEYDNR